MLFQTMPNFKKTVEDLRSVKLDKYDAHPSTYMYYNIEIFEAFVESSLRMMHADPSVIENNVQKDQYYGKVLNKLQQSRTANSKNDQKLIEIDEQIEEIEASRALNFAQQVMKPIYFEALVLMTLMDPSKRLSIPNAYSKLSKLKQKYHSELSNEHILLAERKMVVNDEFQGTIVDEAPNVMPNMVMRNKNAEAFQNADYDVEKTVPMNFCGYIFI